MEFILGFIGAFIIWLIFCKGMHCPVCGGFKVMLTSLNDEHGEYYHCTECGHEGWTNYNNMHSKYETRLLLKKHMKWR